MPTLTRRRNNDPNSEGWRIFYRDVQVGTITRRAGAPIDGAGDAGSARASSQASTAAAPRRPMKGRRRVQVRLAPSATAAHA
jgi:hypothetical protein